MKDKGEGEEKIERAFTSQLGSESGEDEGKESGFLKRVTHCSPILRKFPLSPVVSPQCKDDLGNVLCFL